ncbi:MAG: NAD-dependent epimerase/dehydratase family protein [Lachnospiraceae bacterium]|nr:NAD-dependent epimerase/dehydratase family protein [Lachnospiraceae bacterium]
MKKILITGGTTFVSKYAAEYFVNAGYEVYVLNRNTKPQVRGVKLIEGDRHNLKGILRELSFDVVADITAYNEKDIVDLVTELGAYGQYIMISSSAVYPEYGNQPFLEESEKSVNKFWGTYGTDKIAAEKALLERVKDAYILRPPYLYGPMNNVYREAFVFDCALADRKFYLPKDGDMKLQFFHVKDLCKLMEVIINEKPENHILNVGNVEAVSIKEWVTKCYESLGKTPSFVNVYEDIEQRNYFSFYNYEYYLDVSRQSKIYPETLSLVDGLKDAAEWYLEHSAEVNKKPYFEFIDKNLA